MAHQFRTYDVVTYNGPTKTTNTGRHTIHSGDKCIIYGLHGDRAVIKEVGTCDQYEGTIKANTADLTYLYHGR